jgi:hypothetical protein
VSRLRPDDRGIAAEFAALEELKGTEIQSVNKVEVLEENTFNFTS